MKAADPETIIVFLIAEVKSAFIQMSKLPQPKLAKTQKGKINPKKITSVGIVAFGRNHSADITIKELEFLN